jgi:hypothetical protein
MALRDHILPPEFLDAGEFRMMFIENRMELGPVCASAMESPQ